MKNAPRDACLRMKYELASFRFVDEDDLDYIAPLFTCRQATDGEILWREGRSCDYLVFIIDGRIDIKKETEFEGKQVIVGVYGKGAIVGELCILDDTPRAVTAVALEDSHLLLLMRNNFERLLKENPVHGGQTCSRGCS